MLQPRNFLTEALHPLGAALFTPQRLYAYNKGQEPPGVRARSGRLFLNPGRDMCFMENRNSAVILAAEGGEKIHSQYAKAMAEVLYQPLVVWAIECCKNAGVHNVIVVARREDEKTRQAAAGAGAQVVCSLAQAAEQTAEGGCVFVLPADLFVMGRGVIAEARQFHKENGGELTPLAVNGQPTGAAWFSQKAFAKAAEENGEESAAAGFSQRLAQQEAQHTYSAQPEDLLPFHTRSDLLKINRVANQREIERLWEAGVNIYCTDGVVVSPKAVVGQDTTLHPGIQLKGAVSIGPDCQIGPNTVIDNSTIGAGTTVHSSFIEFSQVGSGVRIGPNSHLRPKSVLADKVKIGNFVEVKNSNIGQGSSVAHLTYIGDTDMGAHVNVGCGCVCVNYDGYNKYRTTIEDDAFIGCNTNLVAPVTVKARAFTAAGSTICQEVPEDALGIARARQTNIDGWAAKHREQGMKQKAAKKK